MTAKERTDAIIAEVGRYSSSSEIRALIEPAIVAAVEAEREACAQIAALEAAPPSEYLPDPAFAEGYQDAAKKIERQIRARAEATK